MRRWRIPGDNIVSLLHGIALIIVLHSRVQSSTIGTSNKNFILKYFRCRDGKRTETRIGMEAVSVLPIPAFHCTLCTCNT